MQEYIRIDEAVRKYWKTRQTFYNYINKGILEVKKINNRLFLDTQAIENLMNTIIEEPSHHWEQKQIAHEHESNNYNRFQHQLDIIEDMITTSYQTNLNQLQENLNSNIISIKQEILYDLKNIFGVQLNHILNNQLSYSVKIDHLDNRFHSFQGYLQQLQQSNKKIFFYWTIIMIMLVNYIISSLL